MGGPTRGISCFTIPDQAIPSQRFRNQFNTKAKELGIPIEWKSDIVEPLAVNVDELRIIVVRGVGAG